MVAELNFRQIGFWTLTLALGIFVATPLALLIINSFQTVSLGELGFKLNHLTLHNYVEAYSNPNTFTMLFNSFWVDHSCRVGHATHHLRAERIERADVVH